MSSRIRPQRVRSQRCVLLFVSSHSAAKSPQAMTVLTAAPHVQSSGHEVRNGYKGLAGLWRVKVQDVPSVVMEITAKAWLMRIEV